MSGKPKGQSKGPKKNSPSGSPSKKPQPITLKTVPKGVWIYAVIAFLSGAAVMSLEMIGSRMIAPILGNSIYTWSALIGVVLIGLSIGGMIGGTMVDQKADGSLMIRFLGVGAIATALAPPLLAMSKSAFLGAGPVSGGLLLSGLLFFAPCVALGATAPLSIRLASDEAGEGHVGFCAGLIGMAGSLGSFVGVIITPFLFVPHFPLSGTVFGLAITVVVAAGLLAVIRPEAWKRVMAQCAPYGIGVVVLAMLFQVGGCVKGDDAHASYLFEQNTPYHMVQVFESGIDGDTRYLKLDTTMEGGITKDEDRLPMRYQNEWSLVLKRETEVRNALFVGGGAFGMPQRVADHYPKAKVEVAEIDPVVVEAGHKFFGLNGYPQVTAKAVDARLYLLQAAESKAYDYVFLDAYNGIRYIPPHLTTREYFQLLRDHLTEDGLVLANVISPIEGEQSRLIWSFVETLESVFEDVRVFPLDPYQRRGSQNIILACGRQPLEYLNKSPLTDADELQAKWGKLLTDELNPVEAYVASQVAAE